MKSSLGGASIRERISKKMGYWSPSGFDAYPEKTDKIIGLIESITKEVIGSDRVKIAPSKNSRDMVFNYIIGYENNLRVEQRERLAQLLGEKK